MTIFFRWLLFLVFGFFLTRTIDLMLIRGSYFRNLSDNNRVRRIKIFAPRGRILSKGNKEIANNELVYYNSSGEEINRGEALKLESAGQQLKKSWRRQYPFGKMVAHLIGYVGEATEEEISSDGYVLGDLVGRGGVEQFYDFSLRGRNGEKMIEVGADGRFIRELGKRDAVPGEDLFLTIDLKWQQPAVQALEAKKGAMVVLDPENGEVLAMVSSPGFDPNVFVQRKDEHQIQGWLNNQELPLLNRAMAGAYAPGSIFKMIPAIAGLEENIVTADKQIEDVGVIRIKKWEFKNWYWTDYGQTEGMVDLVKAIQRSNDIYFYKLGEWTGMDKLLVWSKKFGVGRKTEIDLPAETGGFLPSPEWKKEKTGERWFLGDTYHFSIGQGNLLMTPLQVALETAVFANQGKLCRPKLNRDRETQCVDLGIKKENLSIVRKGMRAACSAGGTAFPLFDLDEEIYCKTGTAEVGSNIEDTHAWLTLFVDDPDYLTEPVVITVFLERGGSGAYDAAPVVKEILESVLSK